MNSTRSFTLLEVVISLALLAGLGVWLLQLEASAVRQVREARSRAQLAARVEALLWSWSVADTPVTLPATGRLDDQLTWRREVRPVRIAPGILPSQISVVVTRHEPHAEPRDVYRVDWLVPRAVPKGVRP